MASAMTPTDTNAVNADEEPKLMRPSSICTTVTRMRAFSGTPRVVLTVAKTEEQGSARSRAKAHVQRDAATVMEMLQKRVMTRTRNVRPRPAPGEPMTIWKMYGRAWPAGAPMMAVRGGRVAQRGMMKKRPAMPPTGTHRVIARGTLMAGASHSSAMAEIMPMAEKQ